MQSVNPVKRQEPRAADSRRAMCSHLQSSDTQFSKLNSADRGFTLIELMVVIVIIGILVGLISAAVLPTIATVKITEARVEIGQLESAIASFEAQFGGAKIPSSITFPENASDWNNASYARSRQAITRIWPDFDFASNGGDTNDGTMDMTGTLDGAECLVFFLGGLQDSGGALVGFSKNGAQPFVLGGNRVGPFFEFDRSRLTTTGAGTNGNPRFPEYLDPLSGQTKPYIYLSSYDGKGYRSADVALLRSRPSPLVPLAGTFVSWYTQTTAGTAYMPGSYQIISPGPDADYGLGGLYDVNTDSVPSEADRDNITNFSSGRLVP